MLPMRNDLIRPLGWASALAVVAAWGAPGGATAPEPAGAQTAALVAGELGDPDLVPPECVWTLDELAAGRFVPAPKSTLVRPTGLVIDWDGDGRV